MVKRTPNLNKSIELEKKEFKDKPENIDTPYIGIVEANEGLIPIGDFGLYATPEEPADVTDCDRYPNSIYCGGLPFTLTPIGIEPSIIIDECNIGIELTPVLAFITLPPLQIVYRKEKCRFKPVPPDEPPPIEQDPNGVTRYNCRDTYYLLGTLIANGTDDPYVITMRQHYNNLILPMYSLTSTDYMYEIANAEAYRLEQFYNEYQGDKKQLERVLEYEVLRVEDLPFLERGAGNLRDINQVIGQSYGESLHEFDATTNRYIKTLPLPYRHTSRVLYRQEESYIIRYRMYKDDRIAANRYSNLPLYVNIRDVLISSSGIPPDCSPLIIPPPPPEKPKKENDMSCCDDLIGLVALLHKKVDKLSLVVGIEDYPVSLPASLISKDEGFFGNLIPNENVDVPSLTRLFAWYIERFDEIMGQWEIPIEIKDSDPTKPGEQPVGIKLPNMAECMAEMFTLCFQTNINSETLLNLCLRTLIETGTDKQQNFISYKLLQSLTDWVGYKQKETKEKMPLSFTLNKTKYDEILKESEVEVPVAEFDEKFGLEADLMRFREAAAILQANHKIKINPNGDVKAQILKYLLDSFKSVNKVNGEDTEQEFEDFLEEVETGFINTRGVTNNKDPYGKPFNERPRIRDLTNFSTDNPE